MPNYLFRALHLLTSGDSEVYSIALTSLKLSGTSTVICSLLSIPLGTLLGLKVFPGRKIIVVFLNTLLALPTVVIGLLLYSLLSRSGPFGPLALLYTPRAVIIGQIVLAMPIITSMVYTALEKTDNALPETLITLGARQRDIFWMTIREGKYAILAAVLAGFGRVIGEVGVSMMLGGNIRYYTRTLTTAIALETSKGEFELGIALGFILMIFAFLVNFILHWVVKRDG